jgi:hypothetical protein
MTYRLRVFEDNTTGNSIWRNYCNAQAKENAGRSETPGVDNLHKFNAVDVKNAPFLDFATEDAMIFKIKFS